MDIFAVQIPVIQVIPQLLFLENAEIAAPAIFMTEEIFPKE